MYFLNKKTSNSKFVGEFVGEELIVRIQKNLMNRHLLLLYKEKMKKVKDISTYVIVSHMQLFSY